MAKSYPHSMTMFKQSIIDEYGYLVCQNCHKSNRAFHVHHIIFRSEKPSHEYLHDHRNFILVCVECHNWFHDKKGNRNKLVEERRLNELFGNDVLNK